MRLTELLSARTSKFWQNLSCRHVVPKFLRYNEFRPFALCNTVSHKSAPIEKLPDCTYEMAVYMSCLKENDFENRPCGDQLRAFNECSRRVEAMWRAAQAQRKAGVLGEGGQRRLSTQQVNRLMTLWRQPGVFFGTQRRQMPCDPYGKRELQVYTLKEGKRLIKRYRETCLKVPKELQADKGKGPRVHVPRKKHPSKSRFR